MSSQSSLSIAAIGMAHEHIYGQVRMLVAQGARLVGCYDADPEPCRKLLAEYPQAKIAQTEEELLNDPAVEVIVTAAVPSERANIGLRALAQGKHVFTDKPGIINQAQLSALKEATRNSGKKYLIYYQMRRAPLVWEMVRRIRSGDIGKVVQVMSVCPHRCGADARPDWFFDLARSGSILMDIGVHHLDLHLLFTGQARGNLRYARMDCVRFTEYEGFYDYGEALFEYAGGSITGSFRLDWLSPDGLNAHGDGRFLVLGSEGYLDYRPSVELAGRVGKGHLFVVNQRESLALSPADVAPTTFSADLYQDFVDGGEKSMIQESIFNTAEMLLEAESEALKDMARR